MSSPKVKIFDMQPEMSEPEEVTEHWSNAFGGGRLMWLFVITPIATW